MKAQKILLFLLLSLLLFTAAFFITYYINRPTPPAHTTEEPPATKEAVLHTTKEADTPLIPPTPTPPPAIRYSVECSETELFLFETDGTSKKTIKKLPFDSALFPPEDILLLQQGIHANSLEDGVRILENFIS